jgi:hypothetical protein
MVYLRDQAVVSGDVAEAMRAEASQLMLALGYDLSFVDPGERDTDAAFLVVVGFRGHCTEQSAKGRMTVAGPLATTSVANSVILPFSNIDCSSLGVFLEPVLKTSRADSRADLYGRAMGRLLAHELYHIVQQTKQHKTSGVAQASLSPRELTSRSFAHGFDRCVHKKLVSRKSSKSI